MVGWLTDLQRNAFRVLLSFPMKFLPMAVAADLTEAIRGALGHWVKYDDY